MLAHFHTPSTRRYWMWALLPLLLAAALTIPLLDADAFNGDEPSSLIAAGSLRSGPLSLDATWNDITGRAPQQAYGWPLLLSVWGRLVGWSAVAIRALSLFFGVLALAWVYRTGHELLSSQAGFFATLLLAASVFFHAYMINARAFTLVALCSTLCIWSYWRIALCSRVRCRKAQFGLLLGSAGLLYMHYFSALFLLIPCLFHLFFIPKNRRWWQPLLLTGLAALLALPQLPGFLQGLARTAADDALSNRALSAANMVSYLVHFLTNGLLGPSTPPGVLLIIILSAALVAVYLLRLRRDNRKSAIWLLVFFSGGFLALTIAVNEVVKVMETSRIRYLMPLWPLTALLAGAGLWRLARKQRRLVTVLLALWLFLGAWLILATDFRYELGFFIRTDLHRVYRTLSEQIRETDLLVVDRTGIWTDGRFLYRRMLERDFNAYLVNGEDLLQQVEQVRSAHPWFWLLFRSGDDRIATGLADNPGLVRCEPAQNLWVFTLVRLARSMTLCSEIPLRLEYETGIWLPWSEIALTDSLLVFETGLRSFDEPLLARYSMAVHVIDPRSGERVAQGDTGVGPGFIVPLRSEIDIGGLPPGDYEVRVALYNWQTGERTPARDLETDEISDMHTLHRFRHD